MKKFISFILIIVFALSFMAINVSAACSLSVSASKKEVLVGQNVTVTFSFSASAAVESADVTVQFDNSKFQYVSVSGGLGNLMPNHQGKTVKISDYGSGGTSKIYKITMTFKAIQVGSGTFKVTSSDIGDANFNSLGSPTGSTTVSVKEESKSNNANLSFLTVPAGCTLVPKFSKNVTSYTCTVPYEITKFPMDWDEEDKDATSTVTALSTLKVGENSRTVTVTAPDGTKKSYTVKVIRQKATVTPTPSAKPSASATATATPTAEPISVTIDDTQYTISTSVTLIVPENFKKENYTYESVEIETAVLGDVRLVQLYDGTRDGLFVYDSIEQKFSPYRHIETPEKDYVILDKKPDVSIEMKEEHVVIDKGEYLAWTSERFGEGYYLLNVVNGKGENYPALYCKDDGSIQKLSLSLFEGAPIASKTPGISQSTPEATVAPTEAVISTPSVPSEESNPIKDFFENLNLVYVGIGACVLILIAIIIVIIVLAMGGKKDDQKHDWGFDEDEEEENSFNFVVEDVNDVAPENDKDSDFE